MEVWPTVVVALGSSLLTGFFGWLVGAAQWRRDRKDAQDRRQIESGEAQQRRITELQQEMIAAFVTGHVEIARMWPLASGSDRDAGLVRECGDAMRSAARSLLLAAEQLAALIGTPEAGRVAEKLARLVIDGFVSVPDDHLAQSDLMWDGRAQGTPPEQHVAGLMAQLSALIPAPGS